MQPGGKSFQRKPFTIMPSSLKFAEISIAGSSMGGLENFVVDSNEAIKFKLLKTAKEMENADIEFEPAMTHQIYGEK